MGGAVCNECAAARVSFHQSFFAQSLHSFAHGSAAHAEALRQLALGGQLIPCFQRTLNDGFFNLLNDLFVESGRPNQFVHCTAPRTWRKTSRKTGYGLATIPHVHRAGARLLNDGHGMQVWWYDHIECITPSARKESFPESNCCSDIFGVPRNGLPQPLPVAIGFQPSKNLEFA